MRRRFFSNNVISVINYLSTDSNVVFPYKGAFDKKIRSNIYLDVGIIEFYGIVTEIGNSAFRDCSRLTSITIPNSVTKIGDGAFYGCSNLTRITIPDSVTSIDQHAFSGCSSLTSVTIPESVTLIGDGAFKDCNSLTSITIPESVTSIEDLAFEGCWNLTSINIGNSVTYIGGHAFKDCSSLISITIPDSVTEIRTSAFSGSSVQNVYISDIIAWCDIDFDDTQANPLNRYANLYLNGNLMTDLVIPDNITKIKPHAFSGCYSLTSIIIHDSVTSIGDEAFFDCKSLKSVTIGDSVMTIGVNAFYNCNKLTSITIGDSVTSIGDYAFYHCSSLISVTIPDSVTSIRNDAFYECSSLTSVYCKATTPPALGNTSVFDNNSSGRKIYVPTESVEAYKSATRWSKYADAIVGYNFEDSGLNITVPLDDSGYGEFTNEQIEQITNYCLQFGESNAVGVLPDGFSLTINSISMDEVFWAQDNGETIIQGRAGVKAEFFIGFGDKYVQFI